MSVNLRNNYKKLYTYNAKPRDKSCTGQTQRENYETDNSLINCSELPPDNCGGGRDGDCAKNEMCCFDGDRGCMCAEPRACPHMPPFTGQTQRENYETDNSLINCSTKKKGHCKEGVCGQGGICCWDGVSGCTCEGRLCARPPPLTGQTQRENYETDNSLINCSTKKQGHCKEGICGKYGVCCPDVDGGCMCVSRVQGCQIHPPS